MIKVLIVEDELFTAQHIKSVLEKNGYEVVAIADSIQSVKDTFKLNPLIAIVDIRLYNNESGIKVAQMLNQRNIPFLFLSANNELHTVKIASQTNPETYLTKPFKENDIIAAFEIIKSKYYSEKFTLNTVNGDQEVFKESILYAKAENVYVDVYLNTEEKLTLRSGLSDLEAAFGNDFLRIHRSFLVNSSKITSKSATNVFLGEVELPVSRSFEGF